MSNRIPKIPTSWLRATLFSAPLILASIAGLPARAEHHRRTAPFVCTSELEYAVWVRGEREVRVVNFSVSGARTRGNTLAHGTVTVSLGGARSFEIHSSASLSQDVVMLKGGNVREQVEMTFRYLNNRSGEPNALNTVSIELDGVDGEIRASNSIIDPETGLLTGQKYPVVCDISVGDL